MTYILVFKYNIVVVEVNEYLLVLLGFKDPIVIFSIFLVLIFTIFFLAMRTSILPKQKEIMQEKNIIEASNIHLMAIFAELDPDPVLRLNRYGEIIFINSAAKKCGLDELVGKPVNSIISSLNIDPEWLIKNNKELTFDFYFLDRYYTVLVKGISYLDISQIYMHDVTEVKKKEEEIVYSKAELKEFSIYLQQKIEEDRKRIARELHDDIGQKMILLKLSLHKDFYNITSKEYSSELQKNSRLIEDITSDIKDIAHSLLPSTLEEIGLYSSLLNLTETIDQKRSIKGYLEFVNLEERLDINLEISIFRIVQEAINNIIKYSKAKEYNIEIIKKPAILRLIISDEGVGFDLRNIKKNRGMGIKDMKERCEIHKGVFKIISAPMEGTVIMINFPLGG